MLNDIQNFADLQAALALATEPTLVTLSDEEGMFVIVSVEVDITGTNNTEGTLLGLVPYEEPTDLPTEPLARTDVLQTHMMMARSSDATIHKPLNKVTTYKKPPNG